MKKSAAAFLFIVLLNGCNVQYCFGQNDPAAPAPVTDPTLDTTAPASPAITQITGTSILTAADLSALAGLTVNEGATLIVDFGSSSANLSGAVTNAGTIYAISTAPTVTTASLTASQLTNQQTGILTTVLPQAGLAGFANLVSNLSLHLDLGSFVNQGLIQSAGNLNIMAANNFINSGTLTSAANLNVTTATAAIVNQGTMQAVQNIALMSGIGSIVNSGNILATAGNINISSMIQNLALNNASGILQASNGSINFGIQDALRNDLSIIGGVLNSQAINIFTNGGTIAARVDNLTGALNTFGDYAHIGTTAPGTLTLGTTIVTDPTFYNMGGDINIAGNILVAERLAIIASGNITIDPSVTSIQASDGTQGFDIHIVAGASNLGSLLNQTGSVGPVPPVSGNAIIDTIVFGPSATGGDIILSSAPSLLISSASTCAGCAGGNVVLTAYNDGAGNGGNIRFAAPTVGQTGTLINASGGVGGANGNVSIIGGGELSVGGITTNGGLAGTGTVLITDAQPTSSDGSSIIFDATGQITSGNNFIPGATVGTASIELINHVTAGSSIQVLAGNGIRQTTNVTATVAGSPLTLNQALTPDASLLLSANPISNSVSVTDTSTNTIIGVILLFVSPTATIISPTGTTAYVLTSSNTITELNINGTVVTVGATFSSGGTSPIAGAFNPQGTKAYIANALSDQITVIDTVTQTVDAVIPVGSFPNGVSFNSANGFLYVSNLNSNDVTVIDSRTNTVVTTVALPSSPLGLGPCPCGTKIIIPLANNTLAEFLTASNSLSAVTIPTQGTGDIAILPSGSSSYALEQSNSSVNIASLLTNQVLQTVALPSMPLSIATGFVDMVPTAYVSDIAANTSVLTTPTLKAPTIVLSALNGDVYATTGSTTLSAISGTGVVQVASNGDVTLNAGGAAGAFQVATPGNVTVNSLTAGTIDMHAINGTFTNNGIISANNGSIVIASPNVVNNGTFTVTDGPGDATINFQAANGILTITQTPTATIDAIGTNGFGLINLNFVGGSSVTVNGGTLNPTEDLNISGSTGYLINIAVDQITTPNGSIVINGQPSNVSITTNTGDIVVCGCLVTASSTGNGGGVNLTANGGNIFFDGDIITAGDGVGNSAGNVTLTAAQDVAIFGGISMIGTNGANAGNLSVNAGGIFGLLGFSGIGIDASSTGLLSGTGGNVTLTADTLSVLGINPDGSAINVSSSQTTPGTVSITARNTDPTLPLEIGPGCSCNTIGGSILANGLTGGTIQIMSGSGVNVLSGTSVDASGIFVGGSILFSNVTPNSGPVVINNDGAIQAQDIAGPGTGRVGFAGGSNPITLTGGGTTFGGEFVSFGMLNPLTLIPSNPLEFAATDNFQFGNISAVQGLPVGAKILVSGTQAAGSSVIAMTPRLTLASTASTPLMAPAVFDLLLPQPLPNTTILSTDQESQSFRTDQRNLQGYINKALNPGQLHHGIRISGSDLTDVDTMGVKITTAGQNALNLAGGNVLLTPTADLIIHTPSGDLHAQAGSAVFIMQTENEVTFYNLHDDMDGSVFFVAGDKKFPVHIGTQLLAGQGTQSFSSMNPGFLISTRNESKTELANGVNVYAAEFSIPSAIKSIAPLRQLWLSKERADQAVTGKVLRNAAILMTLTARGGAYKETKSQ